MSPHSTTPHTTSVMHLALFAFPFSSTHFLKMLRLLQDTQTSTRRAPTIHWGTQRDYKNYKYWTTDHTLLSPFKSEMLLLSLPIKPLYLTNHNKTTAVEDHVWHHHTGGKGQCTELVHCKYIARKWTKYLGCTQLVHPEYIQNFPASFPAISLAWETAEAFTVSQVTWLWCSHYANDGESWVFLKK